MRLAFTVSEYLAEKQERRSIVDVAVIKRRPEPCLPASGSYPDVWSAAISAAVSTRS